jgi:4-hydroxy-tetrahydrodipicolinate synthase
MALGIEGTYTALVTPFRNEPSQAIDWEAFDKLVDAQVQGGVKGLVPCGTTGESPTLSHEEHKEVIARTVKRAAGKAQVIGGTGSNSTREAIAMSKDAERSGVDAVMLVAPYYNRPTQEGLVTHFVTVAQAVGCPVILYNIPVRTGIDVSVDSIARICDKAPNVVGIKEATGNVLRAQELVRRFGSRLTVLSGDDALTLPMVASGAKGVISVTSNLVPQAVTKATRLALAGDMESARRAHLALLPLHESMFLEANPGPVKAALAMRGVMSDVVRGPLVPASEATRKAIAAALEAFRAGGGEA